MEKDGFLFEMQRLVIEMDSLADKYGVRDNLMSLVVTGLLEETPDGETKLKAVYSYNLNNREELEEIIDFAQSTYEEPEDEGPDLTNFLDGLGISLN
mgnify:FL=1|tara:strand:- start:8267 stop:8557 length:291 start_codon:yes stop_codon:yes gene_type:complete